MNPLDVSFWQLLLMVTHVNRVHIVILSVPHISTYDVLVTEGVDDFARILFNRTGGNLEIRTRIIAFTMQNAGM